MNSFHVLDMIGNVFTFAFVGFLIYLYIRSEKD